VMQVDDTPSAVTDSATTAEDTAVIIAVLDNDVGMADEPVIVSIESEPSHGQAIAQDDGTISYVPDADYNGSDAFEYTATDSTGSTATGEVLVTITPVSDAPDAVADTAATFPGEAIDIDVLDNDTDVDGDAFTIESVTASAEGGTVEDNGDGTIRYTPPDGFTNDTDTFSYTIVDDDGDTDTAMVVVAVGIDSDMDGLLDGDEAEHGTAPDDADSDDDGIDDGLEVQTTATDPLDDDSDDDGLLDGNEDLDHDGELDDDETDPNNVDTDADALQDGTESGLAAAEGTGTAPGVFVPDLDPATRTDPTEPDTDGDGLLDGEEDGNRDGEFGSGETDPNDASDGGPGGPGPDPGGTPEPEPGEDCTDAGAECEPPDTTDRYRSAPKDSGGCSVSTPPADGASNAHTLMWLAAATLVLRARRRKRTR
jgi:large repetitive protein